MPWFKNLFYPGKQEYPMKDEGYWKKRHEEYMANKVIVTRYIALFGHGFYGDFCGVKEIEGFYDKTYPVDTRTDGTKLEKTVDVFSQVEPNSYTTYWHFDVKRVFETKEAAQEYYNQNVDFYIRPFAERIQNLQGGINENCYMG